MSSLCVFDIAVEKIDLEPSVLEMAGRIWLQFQIDGCNRVIPTPKCAIGPAISLNYPSRVTFPGGQGYLYINLIYENQSRHPSLIGQSRVNLANFPNSQLKRFSIPLMSIDNLQECKAKTMICASLTHVVVSSQAQNNPASMPTKKMPAEATPRGPHTTPHPPPPPPRPRF